MQLHLKKAAELARTKQFPLCHEQTDLIDQIKNAGKKLIAALQEELIYAIDHNNEEKIATTSLAIRRVQEGIFWGVYAVSEPTL